MNKNQLNAMLLTSSDYVAANKQVLSKLIDIEITETFIDKSPNGIQIPLEGTAQCDVVIVFGNQKPKLQMQRYIPSVCIRVTSGDIIKCLGEHPCDDAAIVLNEASFFGCKCEGDSLHLYTSDQYGSYRTAVDAAKEDGFRTIAGFESCREYAVSCGMGFIAIEPGTESLKISAGLINAELTSIINSYSAEAAMLAVFDGSFSGIITVDKKGMITGMNSKAQFLLNCRNKMIIHEYVINVFPRLDKDVLESALNEGFSINGYRSERGTHSFVVNIEPIIEKGAPAGAVIAFNVVQEKTAKEATETAENGMTADYRFGDFLYISDSFNYVLKRAKFAAYSDNPVLLIGEDGTEIDKFAQSIHNESTREKKGFIEIECDAWDAYHVEQMLFGSTVGGNGSRVQNAVEMAEGGTIFINHIDMLPKSIQYNIYLLISGWYTPLNDVRRLHTNVRIIAATNSDLKELVMKNQFREDLYYALNVLTISIPPLRERKEDIADIASFFINKYSREYNKYISMAKGCMDYISSYDWPGNTAELKSFCKRLVITTQRRNISEAFVRSILDYNKIAKNDGVIREQVAVTKKYSGEAAEIIEALKRNNGNRINTAAELGISKTTLWRKMQKLGITEDYKC